MDNALTRDRMPWLTGDYTKFHYVEPLAKAVNTEENLCRMIAYVRRYSIYAPSTNTVDLINRFSRNFMNVNAFWLHLDSLGYKETCKVGRRVNRRVAEILTLTGHP